jgi:ubiquinone/menaquinone biosynthesis C-methylase UbiE
MSRNKADKPERSARERDASQRYHDRVAKQYDKIYDDPFWDFHDRITWNHIKPLIPRNAAAPVLDLGCGTGKWGLKLLKMGYPTTFSDHAELMLEQVREKIAAWKQQPDLASKADKASVQWVDAIDLSVFPDSSFELVLAMGDVVSICSDPAKCLAQIFAKLRPGGVCVFTVDNQLAAIDHFVTTGNLDALAKFVRTGGTTWLTRDEAEQFPMHMFTPAAIAAQTKRLGYEFISQIGKTVIPARRNKKFFEKPNAVETLVELETALQKDPSAAARASHLQLAVRKPNVSE